jgi:hypothetical protein
MYRASDWSRSESSSIPTSQEFFKAVRRRRRLVRWRRQHPRWLPRRDRHGQDQRARTRRHRLRPALPPCPGGIDPPARRATCTPRAPRCGNLRSLAGKNGRVTVSAAQRNGSCSHCSEACTSRSGLVVRDRIELSTFRFSSRECSPQACSVPGPEPAAADVPAS